MEERQKNNKFLVYLFCFCLVVIVGLVVAIIVKGNIDKPLEDHIVDTEEIDDNDNGHSEATIDSDASMPEIKYPSTGPNSDEEK